MYIKRKLRIFKYWLKMKNTNNIILKEAYEIMLANNDNWVVSIQYELSNIGLNFLYDETCSNQYKTYMIIECRILVIYNQSLMSSFSTSPKRVLYQNLVDNFCLQTYLKKPINYHSKKKKSIFS